MPETITPVRLILVSLLRVLCLPNIYAVAVMLLPFLIETDVNTMHVYGRDESKLYGHNPPSTPNTTYTKAKPERLGYKKYKSFTLP